MRLASHWGKEGSEMIMGKGVHKSVSNCVTLERVFQCYVIAGLFSTSGLDVLLAMTALFLLFAFLRQSVFLLGLGLRGMREPGPLIPLCEAVRATPVRARLQHRFRN